MSGASIWRLVCGCPVGLETENAALMNAAFF